MYRPAKPDDQQFLKGNQFIDLCPAQAKQFGFSQDDEEQGLRGHFLEFLHCHTPFMERNIPFHLSP